MASAQELEAAIAALRAAGPERRGDLLTALEQLALLVQDSDPARALALFQECADIARDMYGNGARWRAITRRFANQRERTGDLDGAGALYDSCQPPPDAGPDERYAWANSRALLAERLADWERAAPHYRDVVDLFDQLQNVGPNTLFGLSNAATFFAGLGQIARARAIFAQFKAALQRQSDSAVTYELPMIEAEIATAAGDLETAQRCWGEVADIARATQQERVLPSIAAVHSAVLLELGRTAEAVSLLRALVAPQHEKPGIAMDEMAAAVTLGGCLAGSGDAAALPEAGGILRRALATESARGMPESEWSILAALADLAAATERTDTAILFGKAAVEIVSTSTDAAASQPVYASRQVERRVAPHRRLVARLVDAGRFPEASQVQAAMKEEAVFELARRDGNLDIRRAVPLREAEQAALDDYRHLCQQSRQAHSAQAAAKAGAAQEAAGRDLRARQEAVAAWLDRVLDDNAPAWRPPAPSSQDETARPAAGVLELRFFAAQDRWRVFARTADGERDYEADGSATAIARDTFDLRRAMTGLKRDWKPRAMALFDRLLRPVDDLLAASSSVRIGADSPLIYLPFAVLHDGSRSLIERVAISYRSGISPGQRPARPAGDWRILLFGNSGGGERPLQNVEDELRSIALSHPTARRIAPFTAASLGAALGAGAEIVHLASHFHLEPARPDLSYLSLDDGERLTPPMLRSDAFNLSQTELLVLSACDTAVAETGPFGLESVAGLAQAKGARRVLGSLWPVADASAARLMALFYGGLRDAGSAPEFPSILRRAQLDLMREKDARRATPPRAGGLSIPQGGAWDHPYHWGGFVLFD